MDIKAFTDGSCKGNPGIGGWGWIVYLIPEGDNIEDQTSLTFCDWGGEDVSTNQKMEARAMAELLKYLYNSYLKNKTILEIEIYTDSMYVLNALFNNASELAKPPKGGSESSLLSDDFKARLKGITGTEKSTVLDNDFSGWLSRKTTKNKILKDLICPENYWNTKVQNGQEWYEIHQSILKLLLLCPLGYEIKFGWVKGHAKNPGNVVADKLANLYSSS